MKQQLQKTLYAFIVTAMMFSASANAQIVYTDVNPDTSIANSGPLYGFYYLDLNNDGTSDDSISYRVSGRVPMGACGGRRVSISVLNGNAVAGSKYPLAMNLNDTISSALTWSASGDLRHIQFSGPICTTIDTFGNWTNLIDNYLGLKLIVGTNTYYGWLRMHVNVTTNANTASGIIKDYAYNSTPNQFILAGDTGAGPTRIIETIASSSINLYPNPTTNQLNIALGSNNKKVQVIIADITGKIIYSTTASETQKIEVNTKDFVEGVYLVEVQSADFIATKKLVVEK
ncbi:MAG: T9SS type A sorting domain-containing protein [Saprospiraceae bacterium]|nr:T9SS type A sorting domain-containing protein [Saprospiraceae bacterium]